MHRNHKEYAHTQRKRETWITLNDSRRLTIYRAVEGFRYLFINY